MNVKASFARSDHRQLSHDDLFSQEREDREEQKRKRKKHQNGRKRKKICLVSRKSPGRSCFSLIKLFVLRSIGMLSYVIVFFCKEVSDIGLNNHLNREK